MGGQPIDKKQLARCQRDDGIVMSLPPCYADLLPLLLFLLFQCIKKHSQIFNKVKLKILILYIG
jgi:hypothetical protein